MAIHTGRIQQIVRHDHFRAIISSGVIASEYMCTNSQQRLKKSQIVSAMERTSYSSEQSETQQRKKNLKYYSVV